MQDIFHSGHHRSICHGCITGPSICKVHIRATAFIFARKKVPKDLKRLRQIQQGGERRSCATARTHCATARTHRATAHSHRATASTHHATARTASARTHCKQPDGELVQLCLVATNELKLRNHHTRGHGVQDGQELGRSLMHRRTQSTNYLFEWASTGAGVTCAFVRSTDIQTCMKQCACVSVGA